MKETVKKLRKLLLIECRGKARSKEVKQLKKQIEQLENTG
jgi:hypothetical protein